jgi:hypothetical protein
MFCLAAAANLVLDDACWFAAIQTLPTAKLTLGRGA